MSIIKSIKNKRAKLSYIQTHGGLRKAIKNKQQSLKKDSFERIEKKYDKYFNNNHVLSTNHVGSLSENNKHVGVKFDIESSRQIEKKFLAQKNFKNYKALFKDFKQSYIHFGHPKYFDTEHVLIKPNKKESANYCLENNFIKLEEWHENHLKELIHDKKKLKEKKKKREKKISKKGLGFSGTMSGVIGDLKQASFFAKNNFTIRGNVYKFGHNAWGKTINEALPRYGSRKGGHIATRVTEFSINAMIFAAGYSLLPVTFGISKVSSDHMRTVVTLSGEIITHKIAGAKKRKIKMHTALRGAQLAIPKSVPGAGDIIQYSELSVMGSASAGIVLTTLADWVMRAASDRYTSRLSVDDIGDPRVLTQIDNRIDYLARFLLPYGQFLLQNENNMKQREKIKSMLKDGFKILKKLEKRKIKALNYYYLALLADRIPPAHINRVKTNVEKTIENLRINSHKTAKKCLASLLDQVSNQKRAQNHQHA